MIEFIHDFILAHGEMVTIQRNTPSGTDIGGFKDSWADNITDFKALIRPNPGSETEAGNKISHVKTYTMYCDVEEIREDDRVIDSGGKVYMIRDVQNPMNFDNHLQISLEVIT